MKNISLKEAGKGFEGKDSAKKVLVLVDKFKGSMTAREVASVISNTLEKAAPGVVTTQLPLADGGDGTIDAIEHFADEVINVTVHDPLGNLIKVPVLRIGDKILCEMAKSTGLWNMSKEMRNPLNTSSYGFGSVIRKMAERGFRDFLLCIGGSATNDVGTGMLSALGYVFRDEKGDPVSTSFKESRSTINMGLSTGAESQEQDFLTEEDSSTKMNLHVQGSFAPHQSNNRRGILPDGFVAGKDLIRICSIDDSFVPDYLRELNIEVACDVNNPLTGNYGSSRVYGPQKGATAEIVEELEKGVVHFSGLAAAHLGVDNSEFPGVGAAGGMGYALKSFLGAQLCSGWRTLFDFLEVEEKISESDIVITGEGRVDGQSLSGKLLDGVLEISLKHQKRVWVICGDNLLSSREVEIAGIEHLFSISQIEPSKDKAIAGAKKFLEKISYIAATFL
jgi:glycerate kinase